MLKQRVLLSVVVWCAAIAAGQAAPPADAGSITSYGLTSTSAPFVALSGATRVAGIEANDASSDAIPVGFTFWYMGVPCTQVWANSNGFLSFNAAAPTTSTANMRANTLSGSPATLRPLVAPLWDDLSGASSGRASYLTAGAPGSRVFTFEWLNWKWSGAAPSPVISMQVRLHEADGRIELAYRQEAGAVSSPSASIGLAATGTGSGNFLSLESTGASPTVSAITEAPSLAARPATGQLYTFTPPAIVPPTPASLTFTGVTGTAMTLNWTDVAGEAGYTVLRSTDGLSYAFAATTAAGTVSYAASGLSMGTTYHWRVYAVTEGLAGAPRSGSQATTPAGEVSCAGAGGNWSSGATWSGGGIPSSSDNVTITNGCTVTLDAAATINRLTVGQGASGVLQFEVTTARTLTVNSDALIATGGTLRAAATGTVTTHLLQVGGSLTNNGTLDLSTNANTAGAELRFTGTSPATFTGTGTTDLRLLSLSKGDIGTVLQVNLPFTVRGAAGSDPVGFLTLPHVGTLRLSGTATYASNLFTSAAYSISSSAGVWLDNPGFTVNGQAGSATVSGQLRVSAGTLNIGTASGNAMGFNSLSRVTIEGGAVNVAGRFGVSSAGTTVTYVQTGGTVTVNAAGNTSTTLASFDLGTSSSTSFTMSGGSIVVRLANTAASGPRDYRAGAGTGVLTGGDLRFGDASSGSAKAFTMAAAAGASATLYPNLILSNTSAGHSLQVVTGPVTGLGVTLQAGTSLTLAGFAFGIAGHLSNSGTMTPAAAGSVLEFVGSAPQTWSGASVTAPLDGLTIDNPAGVTITANPFTALRVNLLRGTLVNSNKVTLGNGGATAAITQYGSPGQTAPAGGYDVAPAFNPGSAGVQVLYLEEGSPRSTGLEIPPSRSVASVTIGNPNGVTLSGGALAITSALTLTSGLWHTTSVNMPTLGTAVATLTGSPSAYVDGPLALQLNSGVNVASRTFPIGTATGWRPVVLGSFHSNGTLRAYTAQVFDGSTGGSPSPPLTSLNPARYVRLQNTAGLFSSTVATVQLSYGLDDVVPSPATARIAQSNTLAGPYTSRGGGASAAPTTGIASDAPINPGDDYFVIADSTPVGPPSNDNCAAATSIPAAGPFPHLTTTVDVSSATGTGDPAFCAAASHTAWYTFTPSTTATYTVSSCQLSAPGTTATDTVVGIFTAASCGGPFTTIACNDNDAACSGGTSRSSVSAVLLGGTTYYMVVGTAGAGTPSPAKIQLAVTQLVPPANDTCAASVPLSLNAPIAGTTVGALDDYRLSGSTCFTSQGQLGNTVSTAPGKDVLYSFTAPAAGKYSLRVTGYAGGDALLYTAGTCPASTFPTPVVVSNCISAADRTVAPAEEVMCQSMTSGQTIYAVVDEFVTGGSSFTIEATSCDQEAGNNNTPAGANPLSCGKQGSIAVGDTDVFALGTTPAGWRSFAMLDAIASGSADTQLRVTDSADVWEFDDDDGDADFGSAGLSSVVSGTVLPGGAVYASVAGLVDGTAVEPYRLYSVLQPPLAEATDESEPNDTPGAADAAGNDYFRGTITTSADADLFTFQATAGDLVFLGLDCDADRDGSAVNGTLSLIASDGSTVLASANGSGSFQIPTPIPGAGLTATTPAFAAEGLVRRITATGTYYAKVTGVPGGTPASQDYALSISRNCQVPSADLAVSQTATPGPITTGNTVTYTVTVTNNGPNQAHNAALTAGIPAQTVFVSVTPPAGWSCDPPAAGQYTCTTAAMASSSQAVFSIVLRVSYCTGNVSFMHSVSVDSDTPDPVQAGNSSSLSRTISDPGACTDNNACTAGDTCVSGACVGGPPPSCSDGNACTADSCNPATGLCQNPPLVCNDGNACTDDSCNVTLGCSFIADNTNTCSDGSLCTSDQCAGGSCVGTPVSCSDSNACTTDSCDPSTGGCLHDNNSDPCDDGDLCTVDDQCGPRVREEFDAVTPPALPAGWVTLLAAGLPGDIAFQTTAAFSDTFPQAAWTDSPEHVTDKMMTSPPIPLSVSGARLGFHHRYDLEEGFDGAVLEIAIGAGPFADILAAGGSFVTGGYDASIAAGEGSPIAGRAAWTGNSAGFAEVSVDLPPSSAGQTVKLRWRVATDAIIGHTGYWVDSIALTDPAGLHTCGGATLSCDDANACTVDGCSPQSGCLNTPGNPGTVCRPSSGAACDPAEMCDGVSASCPFDAFGQSTMVGHTVLVAWTPATSTATISWIAETEPGPFNVYRGNVPGAGSPGTNHVCLMAGLTPESVDDAQSLTPGSFFYYLVSRETSPCLESSLGLRSNGTERPNLNPCL